MLARLAKRSAVNHALTLTALTVLHARAAAGLGRLKAPLRRLPRQQYPHLVEVEYGKVLRARVDDVRHAVSGILHTLEVGAVEDATTALEALRRRFAGALPAARLGPLAVRVLDHQAAQMDRQTRAVLGVPAAGLGITMHATAPAMRLDAKGARPNTGEGDRITEWVAENVSLIKDLADKPLREIEQLVTRAQAAGNRHETLAREISDRLGIADDRAKLIARDQIGKLNGRISADRHQRMGLTRFRWRGVLDARERPEHRALEGTEWPYIKPPSEGLPGEPIQCRCHDEPIFDDVLAELDRLEAERPAIVEAPVFPKNQTIVAPAKTARAPNRPAKVVKPKIAARAPAAPTPRPAKSDPKRMASELVSVGGSGTAQDVKIVVEHVAKLPVAVLEELHASEVSIVVGRKSVTDVMPELRDVAPRGWPPGMTWDNVPGLYNTEDRRVVVTTGERGGRQIRTNHNSADLVAHESGHALDNVRGNESSTPKFSDAYEKDKARGNLGAYYLQEGSAGREEAYAESFAAYVSGTNPGGQFDSLLQFWRDQYDN